ncbi:MAG: class I SAM-dependent methyltransferase [Steroidobacteraceae bacterium]
MSFIDLFSGHADRYAEARPRYPEALFEFIASQSPARTRAWDCGTGNGQAAASLSRQFNDVFATDPSEEQIAHAVRATNVHYSVQPAEATNLPARSMDAICVAQALHWFDLSAFFNEVQRVAAPGAVFAAWGYTWFAVTPAFDAAFREFVGEVIAPYWAPQNKLLWDGYVDVPMPFPRVAAPPFRIEARWTLGQLLAYVRTWSAARRCIAELGMEAFAAAEHKLVATWAAPEEVRDVTMPLHLLVGRVP